MAATISAQVPTEISLIQNLRQVSGMFEEIQLDLAEVEKYLPPLTNLFKRVMDHKEPLPQALPKDIAEASHAHTFSQVYLKMAKKAASCKEPLENATKELEDINRGLLTRATFRKKEGLELSKKHIRALKSHEELTQEGSSLGKRLTEISRCVDALKSLISSAQAPTSLITEKSPAGTSISDKPPTETSLRLKLRSVPDNLEEIASILKGIDEDLLNLTGLFKKVLEQKETLPAAPSKDLAQEYGVSTFSEIPPKMAEKIASCSRTLETTTADLAEIERGLSARATYREKNHKPISDKHNTAVNTHELRAKEGAALKERLSETSHRIDELKILITKSQEPTSFFGKVASWIW